MTENVTNNNEDIDVTFLGLQQVPFKDIALVNVSLLFQSNDYTKSERCVHIQCKESTYQVKRCVDEWTGDVDIDVLHLMKRSLQWAKMVGNDFKGWNISVNGIQVKDQGGKGGKVTLRVKYNTGTENCEYIISYAVSR